MKHLLSVLLIALVLAGCAQKQTVEIKLPNKDQNVNIGKPIEVDNNIGKPIEEIVESIDEIDIVENEMPIIDNSESMKIAFTYPSKMVAKYARTSMNTILAYLAYKKINYQIKVFDSLTESSENLAGTINKIKEAGYTNVIALYTPNALNSLSTIDTSGLKMYFPIINKNSAVEINNNYIFGAISYDKQITKLLEYSNTKNTMFYQESFLGSKLKAKYEAQATDIVVSKVIKKKRNYFKGLVRDNRLRNSTLFLNTSIVKSSILLSQLRAYSIYPKVILSTQLNYNPKLLSLTQVKDRSNFVIANSIDTVDGKLEDMVSNYGGDIKYNWVDYSTLVGISYLYDDNDSEVVSVEIEDNQVNYEPKLFKSTAFGFLEIK